MLKRLFAFGLGALIITVIASPMALYWLGLNGVEGLPVKPVVLVSQERQLLVWVKARGHGIPTITPLNPYSYVLLLAAKSPQPNAPGNLIAWWVASEYLHEHRRYKGMGWWHLSGAALSIWISRNWSTEEMLSKVAESFQHRGLTD